MPADPSHGDVGDIEDIVSSHDVGIADRAGSKSSVVPRARRSRQRNGDGDTVSACEEAEGDSYIPGQLSYIVLIQQYCTTVMYVYATLYLCGCAMTLSADL